MSNNLFTLKQKIQITSLSLLLITFFLVSGNPNLSNLSFEDYLRPYSWYVITLIFLFSLLSFKKENWQFKLKIWLFLAATTIIFYTTTIQLSALFDALPESNAINSNNEILFEQLYQKSFWVKNEVYYRIGKIILFDFLAIFTFIGGCKVINEFEKQ